MAGKPIVVAPEELNLLWQRNAMPEKRASGALVEVVVTAEAAKNPRYRGGTARIIKLLTARGQHVGTIHEIVMPDGAVPHSHPKLYVQRDCSRVRQPEAHETARAWQTDPGIETLDA